MYVTAPLEEETEVEMTDTEQDSSRSFRKEELSQSSIHTDRAKRIDSYVYVFNC